MPANPRAASRLGWLPILGSFAAYALPVVTPHGIWPVGVLLAAGPAGEPGWFAANVAVVVLCQACIGFLIAWCLRGSLLRWMSWLVALPAMAAALNAVLLMAIPYYFLVERETAASQELWPEHCVVPGVALIPVRTSVTAPAAGVRTWWVGKADGSYAVVRIPDCAVVDVALPKPTRQHGGRVDFVFNLHYATSGGASVFQKDVPATASQSYWLLRDSGASMAEIRHPPGHAGVPVLSETADAVGWLQRVEVPDRPDRYRAVIRPLDPSSSQPDTNVELGTGTAVELLGVDTTSREIVVWRDDRPLIVTFAGNVRDAPYTPAVVAAGASTYRRHPTGWLAWDSYRERDPYRLAWSLAAGSGQARSNKGRGITSAAVDASGRYVALSETTTVNIGNLQDVVRVLRASDGSEVLRIPVARYSRSHVVFFDQGLFGYSDLTRTRILRIPE